MRVALIAGLVGFGALFAVAGCATGDEDTGNDDSFATPAAKATLFEQAQNCDALVRDKAGVRAADVKSGVVRWKCGDVDGVTFDKDCAPRLRSGVLRVPRDGRRQGDRRQQAPDRHRRVRVHQRLRRR